MSVDIYFNQHGYYIVGQGIEVTRSLSPAYHDGRPIYEDLQHLYLVLICALDELRDKPLSANVHIYNDSRVIDECNGFEPLTGWYRAVQEYIHQRVLPGIRSVVFFEKRADRDIEKKIEYGRSTMLMPVDRNKVANLAMESGHNTGQQVRNFKRKWLNE